MSGFAIESFTVLSEAVDKIEDSSLHADYILDVCQIPPDADKPITDLEDVAEEVIESATPSNVCGSMEIHRPSADDESKAFTSTRRRVKVQKKAKWKKAADFDSDILLDDISKIIDQFSL